jgi:hypothetical protein
MIVSLISSWAEVTRLGNSGRVRVDPITQSGPTRPACHPCNPNTTQVTQFTDSAISGFQPLGLPSSSLLPSRIQYSNFIVSYTNLYLRPHPLQVLLFPLQLLPNPPHLHCSLRLLLQPHQPQHELWHTRHSLQKPQVRGQQLRLLHRRRVRVDALRLDVQFVPGFPEPLIPIQRGQNRPQNPRIFENHQESRTGSVS